MKSLLEFVKSTNKKFVDIIVLYNNEILLLRRANYMKRFPGKWCLPGGHIDKGEDSSTSIIRELKEETNIDIVSPELWKEWMYSTNETSDIYFIKLQDMPEVKISKEHAQYKWVSIDELVKYSEKLAGETYTMLKQFCEETYSKINEER